MPPEVELKKENPSWSPFQSEFRKQVVLKLFKSARAMEVQMDKLFTEGHKVSAECQFELINGIYSRITDKEYKYCQCH